MTSSKVKRAMFAAGFIATLLFVLSGCAAFRYLDGSTDLEVARYEASAPTAKISALEDRVNGLTGELESRDERISALTEKMQDMAGERDETFEMKIHLGRLHEENAALGRRLADVEKKCESRNNNGRPPKIKVLSGTGRLVSAKIVAERLVELGYAVLKTDYAPRNDFFANVVYYSPGFAMEAEGIAGALGAEIKPLSWFSLFDIIVVAVEESL